MKSTEMKPRNHIRLKKQFLFIGIFLFFAAKLIGADAPKLTISTFNNAVAGQPIDVPLTVKGFTNIGSFYLYLEYDYSKIQFASVTRNAGLTGNYDINDLDIGNGIHRIVFSYSGGINGITLPDSSAIATITFNYIKGPAEISWNTSRDNYCKFTDPQVNKLNDIPKDSFYVNGIVASLVPSAPTIGIITHPTVEDTTGTVELTGLPLGNWVINPGEISGSGSNIIITGLAPGTYNFTVTNADSYTSDPTGDVVINGIPITSSDGLKQNADLVFRNYPNPFRGNTSIEYELPYNGNVTIMLYNHLGQQTEVLINDTQPAGIYRINTNLGDRSPGVYLAKMVLTNARNSIDKTIRLNVLK